MQTNEHVPIRKARILLIDDMPSIHEDYKKILLPGSASDELDALGEELFSDQTSQPKQEQTFEVESAFQGEEGLARVTDALNARDPFALAFVDMRMPPGWDGLETIEKLWQVDPDLHVVICTAYADYSWSEVANRLGSNDRWLVLKKPFDNAEVCQIAVALVEKRRLFDRVFAQVESLQGRVDKGTVALREREARMQAMFETAPDGIATFDTQGIIETCNQAISNMFGFPVEDLIGKSINLLFESFNNLLNGAPSEQLIQRTNLCGHSIQEVDSRRRDGTVFPALWTIGTFNVNSIQRYTAIVRDLTEYKKLECELAQAHKLESVGQLAAGIAHEINTPAQYVGDNVSFLKESFESFQRVIEWVQSHAATENTCVPDEGTKASLQTTLEEADVDYLLEEIPLTIDQTLAGIDRISSIVRAMKEFSHPGKEEKALNDIHAALKTSVTVARNEWKYVAKVTLDLDRDMPGVPCLIGDLNQVFLNLIVNSAQAIEENRGSMPTKPGTIEITSDHDDNWATIRFKDNGIGIPSKILGRVFDPFFTTKEVGKGTGQGLAIARSVVVDKHGGTLDVQSEEGVGTEFTIRLPLAHRQPNQESPQDEESLVRR